MTYMAAGTVPKQLTDEQRQVVESEAPLLSVQAYAGSGKTFTLQQWAAHRRPARVLYLVYNRAMAKEAKERMGENCDVYSAHGLAYARVGRLFQHKLGDVNQFVVGKYIAEHYRGLINGRMFANLGETLKLKATTAVVMLLNAFLQSEKEEIRDFTPKDVPGLDFLAADLNFNDVVFIARWVWDAMQSPEITEMPMSHDGYLKIFVQDFAEEIDRYHGVLLDEAQDTNPLIWKMFLKIPAAQKVVVGDKYQSIYQFRGAINVMEMIPEEQRRFLTTSFRFGKVIAGVANTFLSAYWGEEKLIKGIGKPQEGSSPTAYIHRTNAGIIQSIIENPGLKMKLLGDFKQYKFYDVLDVYNLYLGRRENIGSDFVKMFGDFNELEAYAENYNDLEWASRVEIVKRYKGFIPKVVAKCREWDAEKSDFEVWLTTIHKSKGLEFETVALGDDFCSLLTRDKRGLKVIDENKGGQTITEEEVKLWYVAVTRARRRILTNRQLDDFLDYLRSRAVAAAAFQARKATHPAAT